MKPRKLKKHAKRAGKAYVVVKTGRKAAKKVPKRTPVVIGAVVVAVVGAVVAKRLLSGSDDEPSYVTPPNQGATGSIPPAPASQEESP